MLAGRSLREVEQRIARLIGIVTIMWAGAIGFLLIYFGIVAWCDGRRT